MTRSTSGYLERPAPSGLADVIDIVLSKGIVIDAYARVSLLGIELLTLDARVVVASVDTYLRFAEATNRLDLYEQGGRSLPDLMIEGVEEVTEKVAESVVEEKVDNVVEAVSDTVGSVGEKVRGAVDAVSDVFEDEDRSSDE
jgi:gas vesicle structural protein